jgi:phosphoglucomutase
MAISPLAGKPAPKEMLVDLTRLEREYYQHRPDVGNPSGNLAAKCANSSGSPSSCLARRRT